MIDVIEKVIEFLKMHSCSILKIHYINDTKILRMNDITLSYAYQDKYYKCLLKDVYIQDSMHEVVKRSTEINVISEV
jgi:hypothetical protein